MANSNLQQAFRLVEQQTREALFAADAAAIASGTGYAGSCSIGHSSGPLFIEVSDQFGIRSDGSLIRNTTGCQALPVQVVLQ